MKCVCAQSPSHVQLFETPVDYSPPGSFVRGISQAGILEWVAIPFSMGWNVTFYCSLWNGRTQVLCEAAFNRVLEALGMRGYVLKGNFHQSRHPTHKINHADYEFCACIYFLMGKRSDVSILCHVGWRNKRLGEGSSGYTHNKIFSYIKWTGCQGEKKNPQNMCFQSYDWKTHKALERETDYVP